MCGHHFSVLIPSSVCSWSQIFHRSVSATDYRKLEPIIGTLMRAWCCHDCTLSRSCFPAGYLNADLRTEKCVSCFKDQRMFSRFGGVTSTRYSHISRPKAIEDQNLVSLVWCSTCHLFSQCLSFIFGEHFSPPFHWTMNFAWMPENFDCKSHFGFMKVLFSPAFDFFPSSKLFPSFLFSSLTSPIRGIYSENEPWCIE